MNIRLKDIHTFGIHISLILDELFDNLRMPFSGCKYKSS